MRTPPHLRAPTHAPSFDPSPHRPLGRLHRYCFQGDVTRNIMIPAIALFWFPMGYVLYTSFGQGLGLWHSFGSSHLYYGADWNVHPLPTREETWPYPGYVSYFMPAATGSITLIFTLIFGAWKNMHLLAAILVTNIGTATFWMGARARGTARRLPPSLATHM